MTTPAFPPGSNRPFRQQHHVLTVIPERFWLEWIDDERAIHPALLLEPGVAVIPVGAALPDDEPIRVSFARSNAVEAKSRHPVLIRRQQNAVPVNRRILVECVGHS